MSDLENYTGTVIWFTKNFGFIAWERKGAPQPDLFVYWTDIQMPGFKTLKKEQKVQFNLGLNHHGQPKAINVIVLS